MVVIVDAVVKELERLFASLLSNWELFWRNAEIYFKKFFTVLSDNKKVPTTPAFRRNERKKPGDFSPSLLTYYSIERAN